MKNLADIVLDYLWFLEFTEEDDLHPDVAIKEMEGLNSQLENFSESEKAALIESATRRLDTYGEQLDLSQREFLQAIADGNFKGPLYEDELEDDEDE